MTENFPNTLYIAKNSEGFAGEPKRYLDVPIVMLAKAAEVSQEAMQQLQAISRLPGVVAVHAMPDVQSGPSGTVISTKKCIYPHLVGSDIGCGVGVFFADQSTLKHCMPVESVPIQPEWLQKARALTGIKPTCFDDQLGSIGAGNHFAEICRIKAIRDEKAASSLGLDRHSILLLVHSGSRALGKDVFKQTSARCIEEETPEFEAFLERHEEAFRWAKVNRQLIACRILRCNAHPIIDLSHNSVTKRGDVFLHRKGASPIDQGPFVLPGSRASSSFVLHPRAISDGTAFSSAHGSGRRLSRKEASVKAQQNSYKERSVIIGGTRASLEEEIPEAYKSVDDILEDTLPYADVIAELIPQITIKS